MGLLYALPVYGDAFLHLGCSGYALVDGGRSGRRLAAALKEHAPHLHHIGVVVCTHEDRDHSGGLTDFLNHWKGPGWNGTVSEFWLPGRWAGIAEAALTDPRAFANDLIRELEQFARKQPDLNGDSLAVEQVEAVIADMDGLPIGPDDDGYEDDSGATETVDAPVIREQEIYGDSAVEGEPQPGDMPVWIQRLWGNAEAIVAADEAAAKAIASAKRRVRYRMGQTVTVPHVGAGLGGYWLRLIDTADAIRSVALHAIRHHARMRWFDYAGFEANGHRPRGGVAGFLLPVNAVEQVIPPKIRVSYRETLWLSKENRQSLVFYAPADSQHFGVLFCADSRLGYGRGGRYPFPIIAEAREYGVIATAPHHGSEKNKVAYKHAPGWNVRHWICCANNLMTPGATFRGERERTCTGCPLPGPTPGLPLDLAVIVGLKQITGPNRPWCSRTCPC